MGQDPWLWIHSTANAFPVKEQDQRHVEALWKCHLSGVWEQNSSNHLCNPPPKDTSFYMDYVMLVILNNNHSIYKVPSEICWNRCQKCQKSCLQELSWILFHCKDFLPSLGVEKLLLMGDWENKWVGASRVYQLISESSEDLHNSQSLQISIIWHVSPFFFRGKYWEERLHFWLTSTPWCWNAELQHKKRHTDTSVTQNWWNVLLCLCVCLL